MISRYLALVLSILGIASAVILALSMAQPVPPTPMMGEPAKNPFDMGISASGIVEAVREHVAVGSPLAGLIESVHAEVHQSIKQGEPLFSLDAREIRAELKVKKAKVEVAQAKLLRLEDQLERLRSIQDARAISLGELKTKEYDVRVAQSELEEAAADLDLVETRLERMTVRSPMDGIVIQRKAKVGEYLAPSTRDPAFVIGDLSVLQIRADIDEQNASWMQCQNHAAVAFPKNRPDKKIPLTFVRIEPYVIPKKSLTGMSDERVDTRVLQVIFTMEPPKDFTLYVGQQVDVYINQGEA